MSRTLWLHCGSFKAGSSRIQHLAWDRQEELLADGWLYPRSGLVTDEPDIGVRHSHLVYFHRDPDRWLPMVRELVAEIDASPASHVVMSSEAWSRPGMGAALRDLLATLRDAGVVDEVHGVLYLRNRHAYARSFYRELTRRRGNVLTWPELVEAQPRPLDPLDTVRSLREALAPGRLHVHSYEAAGDTGAHFFGLLGLDADAVEPHSNLSLAAVDVEAHRQLNLLAPELTLAWPGLARVLPAGLPPGVTIRSEDYAERLRAGQLAATPAYRAEVAAETGWDDAALDRLLEPPAATPGHDVTVLGGLLRGVVGRWLTDSAEWVVDVVVHPHPLVAELRLDDVPPTGRFRVGGLLLPATPLPGGSRLSVLGRSEVAAEPGRPSPAYGRRHPDRPESRHARFAALRCEWGGQDRLDVVLTLPSGERSVLATATRRWRLREDPPQA